MGPLALNPIVEGAAGHAPTRRARRTRPESREGAFLSHPPSRLPSHRVVPVSACATLGLHLVILTGLAVLPSATSPSSVERRPQSDVMPAAVSRLVFLPQPGPGGGGGGGGNRRHDPIARAQALGRDRVTVPAARRRIVSAPAATSAPPGQRLELAAQPLAFGTTFQAGLPEGRSLGTTSQGPGSGGGVGDGVGPGIGSGRGSGFGSGSGGGAGGGVYRLGAGVTPPTVILQVQPTYTSEAMRTRLQGAVVLQVVVRRNGIPTDVRVVRSLDPGGLDEQAMVAVRQWRFNPGRSGGVPVDVWVTVIVDFAIR